MRPNTLQSIIASQAVLSSITNKINTEIISENTIVKILNEFQSHASEDIIYGLVFVGSLYSQYKYTYYIENKLQNIDVFMNTQRRTNMILLTVLIIFTKNIENAV
uniref:Uncharacterized protein n=1 Tax=viral metagenome TaxID=1070528 RepID=A0A6C0LS50_9ZZZZ